jgi:hypothetical protein
MKVAFASFTLIRSLLIRRQFTSFFGAAIRHTLEVSAMLLSYPLGCLLDSYQVSAIEHSIRLSGNAGK